jgi:hypothetical protein
VARAPLEISLAYDGGCILPYVTPSIALEVEQNRDLDGLTVPDPTRFTGHVDSSADVRLPRGGTLRIGRSVGATHGMAVGFSF